MLRSQIYKDKCDHRLKIERIGWEYFGYNSLLLSSVGPYTNAVKCSQMQSNAVGPADAVEQVM
jgi:hypothetical protein